MFKKVWGKLEKACILGLGQYHQRKVRDENCIVFITDYMSSRIEKIGYALKKKGFKVIIFLQNKGVGEGIYHNGKNDLYDKLFVFHNMFSLYFLCFQFNPLVYHICSTCYVPKWAALLIKNKKKLGRVVYDQYDIYRDMYGEKKPHLLAYEKYCLENADGLVCRNFQTQYLKKKYHYQYKGERILFLDYCWNRKPPHKTFKSEKEELSIVYGGRLLPRKSNNPLSQIEWDGLSAWVETTKRHSAKMIAVAYNLTNEHEFKDFYRLAKKNPNFVLKEKMDLDELIVYESKMDYGTDTFELAKDQQGNYENFNFEAREKYCATNKYFDYIDAGIPIICGRNQEMLSRYLEKYHIVFWCTLEQLAERMDELKQRRNEYAQNVAVARKRLSVENQILRLIRFYRRLQV